MGRETRCTLSLTLHPAVLSLVPLVVTLPVETVRAEVVRTGPDVGIPRHCAPVRRQVFDLPQLTAANRATLGLVHTELYPHERRRRIK